MAQPATRAERRGAKRAAALGWLYWLLLVPAGCVDGGPHPEPPDPLGPPAGQLDSGVDIDGPSDEGDDLMEAPPSGAGNGGAGGGGAGGRDNEPECADAGVEGGWIDDDAGALR